MKIGDRVRLAPDARVTLLDRYDLDGLVGVVQELEDDFWDCTVHFPDCRRRRTYGFLESDLVLLED